MRALAHLADAALGPAAVIPAPPEPSGRDCTADAIGIVFPIAITLGAVAAVTLAYANGWL